jgi:hypothetical protein
MKEEEEKDLHHHLQSHCNQPTRNTLMFQGEKHSKEPVQFSDQDISRS